MNYFESIPGTNRTEIYEGKRNEAVNFENEASKSITLMVLKPLAQL